VATERLKVSFDTPPVPTVQSDALPDLRITEANGTIVVTGEEFEYAFDEESGTLSSIVYQDTDVLAKGPRLNLWRAPTLVDARGYWGAPASEWRDAGLDSLVHEVRSVDVTEDDGTAQVTVESTVRGGGASRATVTYEYSVLGSGDLLLSVDARPTDSLRAAVSTLPRVGLKLGLPASFDQVQWYGRGPGGSFPDRPGGMRPGVYEGTVAEQFEPVRPPQTHGLKTDTRWAALSNGETGLVAVADTAFTFGVDPFANLSTATTLDSLRRAETLSVTLDHAHMGVGTKFHPPVDSTLVPPEQVRFRMRLRPYEVGEEEPTGLVKRRFVRPNEEK
jgi:beta-galactosidase